MKVDRHSDVLLKLLRSAKSEDDTTLLLKSQSEHEYIIGRDEHGQNGIIIDIDASLPFVIPDSLTPTAYDSQGARRKHASIRMAPRTSAEHLDELRVDQVICKAREKLVICKPFHMVFKSLVLPPRNPLIAQENEKSSSNQEITSDTRWGQHGQNAQYDNVELTLKKKSRNYKLGHSTKWPPPPLPPKASGDDGSEMRHNVKMMTPEDTRKMFNIRTSEYYSIICPLSSLFQDTYYLPLDKVSSHR